MCGIVYFELIMLNFKNLFTDGFIFLYDVLQHDYLTLDVTLQKHIYNNDTFKWAYSSVTVKVLTTQFSKQNYVKIKKKFVFIFKITKINLSIIFENWKST